MNEQYKLIEKKHIDELNGEGLLYEHTQSGAQILFIKNDDRNKTFSVSFRTPPQDDTGLPHILEHAVLCGSRKYPVKDPFNELAKGSLNTFLNAMTFSDKTMYPVASMNDKDFVNLMDVYMDAVFYPNIYDDPKILEQEGWHYELNDKDEDIIYKGVVYNEMKGAFSSAESVLMRRIQQSLFPDTAYGFESGGDPDYITDLSSEVFLNFHKRYYHPANSYIFLYGDLEVDEKLTWLHDNYLKDFEAIDIDSTIKYQEPFKRTKKIEMSYPISSTESKEDNTYLSMNFVTGHKLNPCEYYGLEILEYILLEAPGAPIKKALLDAGIGKDVFGSYDSSIMQPTFSIVAKNANADQRDDFVKIIRKTIKKIAEEGLDDKKVQAAINYFEFKIKEADFGRYPKGIIYAIKALDSWLYEGSPFGYFEYNEAFKSLKAGTEDGCLNNLLQKYFVDNKHITVLSLVPDDEMLSKRDAEIKEALNQYKASLSDDEIEALVENTKALEVYQNEGDTPEALATIPLLELKDVDKKIDPLESDVIDVRGTKIIRHHAFTNDILYMKWVFDLSVCEEEDLPYAKLLSRLLGKMSTENYEYSDLSDEINIHTGGISFSTQVYMDADDTDKIHPKFQVHGKCFMENADHMIRLVEEIILKTIFDDTKRLKELLMEAKSRTEMVLSSNGHATSATRASSYISPTGKAKDLMNGIAYYDALIQMQNLLDKDSESLIGHLEGLCESIFRGANLIIGSTYQEVYDTEVDALIEEHLDIYDPEASLEAKLELQLNKANEGIMTSDKIQYVAKAGNFVKAGYRYSGSMKVLRSIVSRDYLWINIRIKGGAYGAMSNMHRNGDMFFVSYRDPNLIKTIHHYDVMCEYIENFNADERTLRKYILGTISDMDQPLTPSMENDKVLSLYIGGISDEILQRERTEVLETSVEDIRELYSMVQQVMGQNNLCVLGNESKIKENQDVFIETRYLKQ